MNEIYKILICEKSKNFTNKNNKLCSTINCDKKTGKNRKFYENLKNCAKKTNILRIIEKTFINFVDAKVEQIEVE